MLDTAKLCKENDIKTVVVSNGQINEKPLRELIKYIDAFNIDLKAFNKDFYIKICKGELETTKKTLEIICSEKKHLEITFLLIEGLNDNEIEFVQMCDFIKCLGDDVVFHISRAFPRYKMDFNITPSSLLDKFYKTAKSKIKNVYVGNV
jgi:pyruvate formate lyase activating enzyme